MADTIRQRVALAGIELDLDAPAPLHLREDSLWRLRQRYQPFLAGLSLPQTGTAIDIGAGFGAFALPFAQRYPGWQVWCFEPLPEAFAALEANIARLGLSNVRALPFAVAEDPDHPPDPARMAALKACDAGTLRGLLPEKPYRHHHEMNGFLDAEPQRDPLAGSDPKFRLLSLPTLAAQDLHALAPDFLKLVAPKAERGILQALADAPPAWLVGESWQELDPALLDEAPAQGAAWLPFAASPQLALRRTPQIGAPALAPPKASLSVIAQLDSEADATALTAVLPEDARLHAVLPPDATLPTSGTSNSRWHRADNPGPAPAFNLGLRLDEGTHLLFLGPMDRPAPGSLGALMAMARLSGAEIVQGGDRLGPQWVDLPRQSTFRLKGHRGAFLPVRRLLADFPPSRARLYRRDYLAQRGLHFSEHLAAFSEHELHFRALQGLPAMPVLTGATIDTPLSTGLVGEDAFLLLEAMRRVLRHALTRPARELGPLFDGMVLAVRTLAPRLSRAIRPRFIKGLAEFLLLAERALGSEMPSAPEAMLPDFPGLSSQLDASRTALAGQQGGYGWGMLDAPEMKATLARQARLWATPD